MAEADKIFSDEVLKFRTLVCLGALVQAAHRNAVNHGFYDEIDKTVRALEQQDLPTLVDAVKRDFILAQLEKIGEENGEACHALRKDQRGEFIEELADICIRTFDLAGFVTTPDEFAHVLVCKMTKNISRERLHGKTC